MKANEEFLPWAELSQRLRILAMVLDVNDVPVIRQMLEDLVGGYQPGGEVVDWVHLEHYAEADMESADDIVEERGTTMAKVSAHEAMSTALARSRAAASIQILRGEPGSATP
ncbi:hypothetical protein D3C78_1309510 [compost metagenome]